MLEHRDAKKLMWKIKYIIFQDSSFVYFVYVDDFNAIRFVHTSYSLD